MVFEQSNIDHIMRGLQSTEGVRLHNHRKKLRQRFDIIKKLGQGTYGKVQLGINKETGQEVAIKTIKKCKIETEADLIRIRREIQIMSSVRHPNIIHIYEVFENREKMVLVMEYAAGGELYDYLSERKVLEETEARRIFRQISTAVYYCHKHKICHRDLKLENILLDEHGSAKIADFGLSNVYEEKRLLQTFCGSPLYASPEIVRGTPYRGPEVDCWSLGVLLYTLVYGAMPFDGSNFKRLVKQISNGDYFEPKKPSPASPLIREMLTVDPVKRATIETICTHWWVNEGFNVSCLDIAEDLANQTPVRLDLLLSLVPPPESNENLVVTEEQAALASQEPPPRSMSMGSILELNSTQEGRRAELLDEKASKRKLEPGSSETSVSKSSPKKKESRSEVPQSAATTPSAPTPSAGPDGVVGSVPETQSMEVDSETAAVAVEEAAALPVAQAEAATAPQTPLGNEDEAKGDGGIAKDKPTRKSVKTVKKKVVKDGSETKKTKGEVSADGDKKEGEEKKVLKKEVKKESSRASEPREEVGKEIKREGSTRKSRGNLKLNLNKDREKSETPGPAEEGPSKPMERRKSKVFETAEKFATPEPKSPSVEKPKKVFIPGVKVSDFAKAFERKSSISSTPPPQGVRTSPPKKPVPKEEKSESKEVTPPQERTPTPVAETVTSPEPVASVSPEKVTKLKESARNVIANALVEEERKKVKKLMKPPVPRTKTDDNLLENKKKALTLQIGKEKATVEVHTPENSKFLFEPDMNAKEGSRADSPKEKKIAKVNITLKSNTLPRRTSKAEIQLSSPSFRTEVEHRVGEPANTYKTQRSEVAFPVSAAPKSIRSVSLEPESQRKERIIPIQVEDKSEESRDRLGQLEQRQDIPARGRPPSLPYQRTFSQRSSSLSRQSTQDSDTESTVSADPIRKSPREFIIPIAVEGGGIVTPRATSLEPSESMSKRRPFPRRISLFSENGSEDESSWRHDLEEPFRMHRLRSSRPTRADSLSGSEDEEDDGFEILTAENLFSTLLSRVRSLTTRLNVEDGGRPGFPRMSSQFGPSHRLFTGLHEPITRLTERSLSRDMENGRWPRGADVSESSRSNSRGQSRSRQFENDVESLGDCTVRPRRTKRSISHNRSKSLREEVPGSNSVQKRSSSHNRSLSDAVVKSAESRESIAAVDEPSGRDFYDILADKYGVVPMRRYDLEPPRGRRSASADGRAPKTEEEVKTEEASPGSSPARGKKEATPTEKFKTPSEKLAAVLNQLEGAYEKKDEKKETSKDVRGIPNDLLFAKKEKAKKMPELMRIENDRLKDLSPRALELYEKTLGLYQKTLMDAEAKKKRKEGDLKKTVPAKVELATPEKVRDDYFKNKKLKHYGGLLKQAENSKEGTPVETFKAINNESEVKSREDSPLVSKKEKLIRRLSRELEREMSPVVKEDGFTRRSGKDAELLRQGENLIKRLSKELEKEMEKEKNAKTTPQQSTAPKEINLRDSPKQIEPSPQPEPAKAAAKNKIFSTLEKKLEKLRAPTEKKYIDKAIRSLRENSVGPSDVPSENFLIKRAVSLSECADQAPVTTGKVQSTVNSVLGLFKRLDSREEKSKCGEGLLESTPPLLTPESSPVKDDKKLTAKESPSRRQSALYGNNSLISCNDSSSIVSPDSESYDSWSNCSDFGNPDDLPITKPISPIMKNYIDDTASESVSDRIRRKSFYSRFNEKKRSRKSSILDGRKRSEEENREERPVYTRSTSQNLEKVRSPQPYVRSSTSADYSRKWYDDSRPRPFYKSEASSPKAESPFRKTSLDWSKTLTPPTFVRSRSQTSSVSSFAPVSSATRPYLGSYDSLRRPRTESDRPFSPTRSAFSPSPTFDL